MLVSNFHIPRLADESNTTSFLRAAISIYGGKVRVSLSRISMCITVIVSFERCLCILLPLKIKLLFTPRRTAWAIAVVSVISAITTILFLVNVQVHERFDLGTNVTFLSLEFENSPFSLTEISKILISCIQIICLLGIVVANGMLIWGLKRNDRMRNRWSENDHPISALTARHELHAVPSSANAQSSRPAPRTATRAARDRKLGRMAVTLSGIHLTSFLPTFVWVISAQAWPELKGINRYFFVYFFAFEVKKPR
ncbi:chemosensory receptor b [Plakobranchus ocellatus]|uniref:Chemosensory receptor b n=1 Tax=Plakobranchus ocellatus TaxID=259542 RepID=A0AAV4AVN8_9GAST|nr:chemosensory receptor b [Plakobranchus ocellatus]